MCNHHPCSIKCPHIFLWNALYLQQKPNISPAIPHVYAYKILNSSPNAPQFLHQMPHISPIKFPTFSPSDAPHFPHQIPHIFPIKCPTFSPSDAPHFPHQMPHIFPIKHPTFSPSSAAHLPPNLTSPGPAVNIAQSLSSSIVFWVITSWPLMTKVISASGAPWLHSTESAL